MKKKARTTRFAALTEGPGVRVTRQARDMLVTRYVLAAKIGSGKRVLEIACGPAIGAGILERSVRMFVAGDIELKPLLEARQHYGARVMLLQFDVQGLPFAAACFDLVICFESTYYVPDMDVAFDEIQRVVALDGRVMFVNANPDRSDFIRSPHSVHYHTASEFEQALETRGFSVCIQGAFPVDRRSVFFRFARRVANRLHLVPRSLRGRARLKRLIYGRLDEVPKEIDSGYGHVEPLSHLTENDLSEYAVIYVIAAKNK